MTDTPARLSTALSNRYRIERELGQGGMATVYLAQDLKHDRKVALKVLKPELAAVLGAERFVVEIKTTAALQHPHILPLFDSGSAGQQDGGTAYLFYVMPFIDGETLRSKLDRETQLGIEEAVKITIAVADALDYAHRHGVIHRDIKPENILLHEGRPMVADFGIALAVSAAAGGRMTETGLSLGTPHYMSPEQATAEKEISARSDVYSLASVLYEMLAGEPPHSGGSAQQVIMKIVTEEAQPLTRRRKSVPANVAAAVGKALEKLPADRFESARAFAAALGDSHFRGSATASHAAARFRGRRMPVGVVIGLATLVALAVALGWIGRGWRLRPTPSVPIRFSTTLGTPGVDRPRIAISTDGRLIVQAVSDSTGVTRLTVRDLTRNRVTVIPGTEQANGGEFSPQGDWIAFEADDQLRKVPVAGGPTMTLVSSMTVDGGDVAWTPSGEIVFSGRDTGLWRVPADGGTPVQLTQIDTSRSEFGHWAPRMLPGGRAMIYTNYATPIARSRIEAYEFDTGRTTVLAEGAVFGRYAPTGHLLFARDGAVFAVAFDPDRLETRGTPLPVQDDVVWEATNGFAGYDISANGTFVYLQASEWDRDGTMVWRDRIGRDVPVFQRPGAFQQLRLSPDGRWIAYTLAKPKLELWLYDLSRQTTTQLTRAPSAALNAVWMLDSRRVVYTFEDRVYELHVIPIDASAPDRTLLTSAYDKFAQSISPDGQVLLMMENPGRDRLMLVPLDSGGGPPRPMAQSALEQRLGTFSPNGRWIAYAEHGEGRADIYLRAVTGADGRRLVSSGGGSEPRWTRGGREIVYLGSSAMMSVSIDPVTGESRQADDALPRHRSGARSLGPAAQRRCHARWITISGGEVNPPTGRPAAGRGPRLAPGCGPVPQELAVIPAFDRLTAALSDCYRIELEARNIDLVRVLS